MYFKNYLNNIYDLLIFSRKEFQQKYVKKKLSS